VLVGREEDGKRRAVSDLGIQAAGRAKRQSDLVPALALKVLRNALGRRRKIGRHGHLNRRGLGDGGPRQQDARQSHTSGDETGPDRRPVQLEGGHGKAIRYGGSEF
jgi:hypothetical protein